MSVISPKRILLKLSGEALMGQQESGIDPAMLGRVAREIQEIKQAGTQIALVLGGGNLFRGAGLAAAGMDRVRGDQMGMLATVMNALAMQDCLERLDVTCRLMTAFPMGILSESYSPHQARSALDQGQIVICAAGTGNPYFTTDTAASLRAIELKADLLLKATKVDGVYDSDPAVHRHAKRYDRLSFDEALAKQLGVMDLTAMIMCRDNQLPLRVFDMFAEGALASIMKGEPIGTLLENEK